MSVEAQALLGAQIGRLRRGVGRAQYWHFHWFLRRRHRCAVLEQVEHVALLILPGVLNPRLMRTGAYFATQLKDLLPAPGSVLDMGTGSGICAVTAASLAGRVTGVDINAQAVRCARANVLLNNVEDRVEILNGDLFAPVAERRFDVVLFNPPFYSGVPKDAADRAWRSNDVPQRFAAGLAAHLTPRGFALLLLSTCGDANAYLNELARHGFQIELAARRSYVNERLVILKITSGG